MGYIRNSNLDSMVLGVREQHYMNGEWRKDKVQSRDDRIYSDSIRIRIFFLESRIFGFGFDNFWARILFKYSNLFPWISNIWNIFFLWILNINWEFLGALPTCLSHLWAPIDKTCAWMLLSLDTFMSFLEYAFSIPVFSLLFFTFCSNITELFE